MDARTIVAALGLWALVLATLGRGGEGPDLRRFNFTEPHMGTAFTIVLYTGDEATASRASKAAFERIKSLDQTLTDYDPNSELMRLCTQAGGPPAAGLAIVPLTAG